MRINGNAGPSYAGVVVTEADAFDALEPEWGALWARAPASYVSETFPWIRLCIAHPPDRRRRSLFCVTVRDGRQLIAVMPLMVSQMAGWRVGAPLTWTSEYCPFLVDPQADADAVWRAVRGAVARGGLDALRLLNVDAGSALGCCLSRQAKPPVRLYATPLMSIAAADIADWNSYRQRMPAKKRRTLAQRRRQLTETSHVVFEDVTDADDLARTWRWMINQKRHWAIQKGRGSNWLFTETFERFVAAGLEALGPSGARRIFVLKADGRPIAAELLSIDASRMEAFITVYDEAYARYSPANLLHEDCMIWAGQRGLAYDMRLGEGFGKESWATQRSEAVSYVVPITAWGELFAASMKTAASLGVARWRRPAPSPQAAAGVAAGADPAIMQGRKRRTISSNGYRVSSAGRSGG